MVTPIFDISPSYFQDDRRKDYHATIEYIKAAQDIYQIPPIDIQKATIISLIKRVLFDDMPKIFDDISINIKSETIENKVFDSEDYRKSRILYDAIKPFFNKFKTIEISASITEEKELILHKSVVNLLYVLKDYVTYLDMKFAEIDKPKLDSRFFTHIPESELWEKRNKNRPYII